MLSNEYKQVLQDTHTADISWGASASVYEIPFIDQYNTVLDYGCGKGVLKQKHPKIQLYDPAIPAFRHEPTPAELVLCLDVLEHVEPEYLDSVLFHIKSLTLTRAYFIISTVPAKKMLINGENAHLIVRNADWWGEKISEYFNVVGFSKQFNYVVIDGR